MLSLVLVGVHVDEAHINHLRDLGAVERQAQSMRARALEGPLGHEQPVALRRLQGAALRGAARRRDLDGQGAGSDRLPGFQDREVGQELRGDPAYEGRILHEQLHFLREQRQTDRLFFLAFDGMCVFGTGAVRVRIAALSAVTIAVAAGGGTNQQQPDHAPR
ncbi:MAG: hypothetical protein HY763_06190 [Planctomycetes bacterium]|nr:hypothetical protein [Planctomycetota bacterium]